MAQHDPNLGEDPPLSDSLILKIGAVLLVFFVALIAGWVNSAQAGEVLEDNWVELNSNAPPAFGEEVELKPGFFRRAPSRSLSEPPGQSFSRLSILSTCSNRLVLTQRSATANKSYFQNMACTFSR